MDEAATTNQVELSPDVLKKLEETAAHLGPVSSLWGEGTSVQDQAALSELVERLSDMYPYGDERYIGQIITPPHPVAWTAYALTALLNPNNHALDGGPATAKLEKEVVEELAAMVGYKDHLGHLTSSGTIANLEALFIARELNPTGVIVSSEAAHYTHKRMCGLLAVPFETIPEDSLGRMDTTALEARLKQGGVGTIVATLGTTSLGSIDQVHEIIALARQYGARVHVDAAYGGFHTLNAKIDDPVVDPAPFLAIAEADSIVIDPHKQGLQPYGCGSVLFKDPSVGRYYKHDSPYTYFTSAELHLGEISLECSRAGASAAALWTTLRSIPLSADGLGARLAKQRQGALRIAEKIRESGSVGVVVEPELDIVSFYPKLASASAISKATLQAFDDLAADGWHTAVLQVNSDWLLSTGAEFENDAPTVSVIRCSLMKPEHLDVADEFAAKSITVFEALSE